MKNIKKYKRKICISYIIESKKYGKVQLSILRKKNSKGAINILFIFKTQFKLLCNRYIFNIHKYI